MEVLTDDMFIPGSQVGYTDSRCYLPIFQNLHGDQDIWYLGNIFMKKYYTVFDMSPFEQNLNYLHLGIGL